MEFRAKDMLRRVGRLENNGDGGPGLWFLRVVSTLAAWYAGLTDADIQKLVEDGRTM